MEMDDDLEYIRGAWPDCTCCTCGWDEVAFLLLRQRTRIHHPSIKPQFGVRCMPDLVASWLLENASPWFIKENHD
jgi:hypothetical protein